MKTLLTLMFCTLIASAQTVETVQARFRAIELPYPIKDYVMFEPANWPSTWTPTWYPWCPLDDLKTWFFGFQPGDKVAIQSTVVDELYIVPVFRCSMMPPAWQGASFPLVPTISGGNVYITIFAPGTAPMQLWQTWGVNYGVFPVFEIQTSGQHWIQTDPAASWPNADYACPIVWQAPIGTVLPLSGIAVEIQVTFNIAVAPTFGTLAAFQSFIEVL